METAIPASETAVDFPGLLRFWRTRRGYSQLALSLAAGVSQRHISFLESGRARPSREMILALADCLNVPLRQRNRLLLAAGFAPVFSEHQLDEPPLQMVQQAVRLILDKQEPYPAVVLDRFWNLIDANRAYRRMLAALLGEDHPAAAHGIDGDDEDANEIGGRLLTPSRPPGLNLMLAVFDPDGLWPTLENAEQVGRYLLRRVWQELQGQAHERAAREIFTRIARWHPDMVRDGVPLVDAMADGIAEAGLPPVLPVAVRRGPFRVAMFSTLTTLGNPHDITLQEMRIECFFPADEASRRVFEDLATKDRPARMAAAG
ncbi:helix-turn-helix domain-containing protein [Cupriavidus sp. AU9028]|uniref:helix-turn-helix domain-containing protein n=1 Tax=Cupriavidus sp. AU9028 TaxID=2871157 RepID=UPI001C937EE9|nr:helix-turn-helix transcriptional regulator [Cupriavidus sp. AU9028]MBY4896009.1 helix-turn-helix transcriptional regulator [Cupriavidus sp. AU9028]